MEPTIEMSLISLIDSIFYATMEINIKELPTQGYFYPKDFSFSIKKASLEDIIDYNFNYIKNDLSYILYQTHKIVKNNTIFTKYKYEDIKSEDIIYIFFEIVKFTMNTDIKIHTSKDEYITFESKHFNYFNYLSFNCDYDENTREFIKDGYRFSLLSVGVHECLTKYIYKKSCNGETTNNNYDFLFFLNNKNYLSDNEIDNLIIIFNEEISKEDYIKIKRIVDMIAGGFVYSLKRGNEIIDLHSKINFEMLFL